VAEDEELPVRTPVPADVLNRLESALATTGALTRTLTISLGPVPASLGAVIELTEVVVHGLDLAVATGRTEGIDQAQVE
jgi:hypothetical protein